MSLAVPFVLLLLFLAIKPKSKSHINSDGYVVLNESGELEHRFIATQILNRKLYRNEIVHHINGRKTENQIYNLCVMDREKHEHFHAWLDWKRKKTRRYPSFKEQKKILVSDYQGILLEHAKFDEQPISKPNQFEPNEKSILQNRLYIELKKERTKLALAKNVPLYIIFDNRTLEEMALEMPESEDEIMKITGVGPIKLKEYGASFIAVVKSFKANINASNTRP